MGHGSSLPFVDIISQKDRGFIITLVAWSVTYSRRLGMFLIALSIMLTVASCRGNRTTGPEDTTTSQVESIAITDDSTTVVVGNTINLEASIEYTKGKGKGGAPSVKWRSFDTLVAEVDSDGTVTGKSAGKVGIEARARSARDTTEIDVIEASSNDTFSSNDTTLGQPTNVSVSEAERTDSTVIYSGSWSSVSSADFYEWDTGSDDGSWTESGTTNDTTVSFTAPRSSAPDSSFFCVAAGRDGGGTGEPGCTAFTVPATGTTSDSSLATPSGLNVSSESDSSARGVFDDNSYEDEYQVYRNDGSGWVVAADLAADDTVFRDTELSSGTTYGYRVRAISTSDTSEFSEVDSVTTAQTDTTESTGIGMWRGNEPTGYIPLASDDYDDSTDWGWDALDGNVLGGNPNDEPSIEGNGADGTFRTVFTSGMSDGLSAANSSAILGGTYPELYVAFTFKAESDFEFHSNAIKHFLFFVDDGSGSNVQGFTYITTPDGDLTEGRQDMYMNPTTEQITSSKPEGRVEAGQWHQVEVQFVVNQSGSNTGILRIWLNGTLIIEDTNFENPGNGVTEVKFANTWGGGGQEVPKDQYIDVGHVYVSGNN